MLPISLQFIIITSFRCVCTLIGSRSTWASSLGYTAQVSFLIRSLLLHVFFSHLTHELNHISRNFCYSSFVQTASAIQTHQSSHSSAATSKCSATTKTSCSSACCTVPASTSKLSPFLVRYCIIIVITYVYDMALQEKMLLWPRIFLPKTTAIVSKFVPSVLCCKLSLFRTIIGPACDCSKAVHASAEIHGPVVRNLIRLLVYFHFDAYT